MKRKEGIPERRNTGKEGCKKGGICKVKEVCKQESICKGKEGCRKVGKQDRKMDQFDLIEMELSVVIQQKESTNSF